MSSLSAWVYIQKINMFSTAGSVVTGRIFVTSPIYFVLCDAYFHRSTCSISLMCGDDFLRLLCMFSCFQNLYGLHDLSQSRTWLLDYCRTHFSSEDFRRLFWRNRQLVSGKYFRHCPTLLGDRYKCIFFLYLQNSNLMIEVMVTKYSHVMNKWMCELHLLSFHLFPASRSVLQAFVRENVICCIHALGKCACFLINFFFLFFFVCVCVQPGTLTIVGSWKM